MNGSAERHRTPRVRIEPRLVALLLLLPLTFLASRSCGDTHHDVTQSEAVAIAKKQVTYRPDGENVRFVRRGIPPPPTGRSRCGGAEPTAATRM